MDDLATEHNCLLGLPWSPQYLADRCQQPLFLHNVLLALLELPGQDLMQSIVVKFQLQSPLGCSHHLVKQRHTGVVFLTAEVQV